MNAGLCTGGPLNGQMAACDRPSGFFHVIQSQQRVWLYAWIQGAYFCRTPAVGEPYNAGKVQAAARDRFSIKVVA